MEDGFPAWGVKFSWDPDMANISAAMLFVLMTKEEVAVPTNAEPKNQF